MGNPYFISKIKTVLWRFKIAPFLMVFYCFNQSMGLCAFSEPKSRIVRLTTLDWKPYTGHDLKEMGMTTYVVKEAFKKMGYTLEVTFLPWRRAVHYALNHQKYSGYFPEYDSSEGRKHFLFSQSIGESPLRFIEHPPSSIRWKDLEDLKSYTIGVVAGYVNTKKFDALVKKNVLNTEEVSSDLLNILKVASKKIPLAIVDRNVLDYWLKNPDYVFLQKKIVLNPKVLENKKLYICFRKDPQGAFFNRIFSQGLKKLDLKRLSQAYEMTAPPGG